MALIVAFSPCVLKGWRVWEWEGLKTVMVSQRGNMVLVKEEDLKNYGVSNTVTASSVGGPF
jgi:hypothetical protein